MLRPQASETKMSFILELEKIFNHVEERESRGEQERLFDSREREGKFEITFPLYGRGRKI